MTKVTTVDTELLKVNALKPAERSDQEEAPFRWLSINGEKKKVFYEDILYLEKIKATKYVEYVTQKGECRERINLKDLRQELECFGFVLIDRSCMVNIKHISRIGKVSVFLDNGEEFIISRDRRAIVREMLGKAMEQGEYEEK